MKGVRVLVFGAIGHIGANLGPHLLREGCTSRVSVCNRPGTQREDREVASSVSPLSDNFMNTILAMRRSATGRRFQFDKSNCERTA